MVRWCNGRGKHKEMEGGVMARGKMHVEMQKDTISTKVSLNRTRDWTLFYLRLSQIPFLTFLTKARSLDPGAC